MKVGGLRTVGPSTVRVPRRYMLQSRRELPSTVPAVYAAKPPGVPIHRKPPVLFLSGSICWDQLSILEIIGADRPVLSLRWRLGLPAPGSSGNWPNDNSVATPMHHVTLRPR